MATRARVADWEDPLCRFLSGDSNLWFESHGKSFNIYEAVVHLRHCFPMKINDYTLEYETAAAHLIITLGDSGVVANKISRATFKKLASTLSKDGFDIGDPPDNHLW